MNHHKSDLDKILQSSSKDDHITLWLVKQTNSPILRKNAGFSHLCTCRLSGSI
jgi:hypothetical protein